MARFCSGGTMDTRLSNAAILPAAALAVAPAGMPKSTKKTTI
jgi:hypothetical protein